MTAAYETRVVPSEPTGEMTVAGAHVHDQRPSEVAAIYRAMLAAAPLSGWQPIETAPKDGMVVLVCGTGTKGYYVADAKWDDGWWMFDPLTDGYDLDSYGHTHWMPLPPPPSGERAPARDLQHAGITSLHNPQG